jgi:site-specific recombinase XerD
MFGRFLGGIPDAKRVNGDDLRRFIAALRNRQTWAACPNRRKRTLSPTSINTYVRAIRAFWGWLEREGTISTNPFSSVKPPKKPRLLPRIYSEEQLRTILRAVERQPRERAIIELFLDSGMRLSELTSLQLKDLDLKNLSILVYGKGSKERLVYVSPGTALRLQDYITSRLANTKQQHVFLTADGRPLSPARIQKILRLIGEHIGLSEPLAPHRLRHTFATLSLRNGSNLEYLRLALGHSDIKTTSESYLAVSNSDVALAHRRFSPMANLKMVGSRNACIE